MRKVLALMLMLFVLASAVPLVGANPAPGFKNTSAFAASYIALVIFLVVIANSVVFLIRRKKVAAQSLLYLLALSCWVSYFVIAIYGGTYSVTEAIGRRLTEFGYVTLAINYTTMIVTSVAIAYSGYLIIRRKKLSRNQSFL